MLDVEYISELAVAYLNGIQNKKKKLEEYYQQYEKSFDEAEAVRTTFGKVLGEIEQLLPNFSKTRWRKKSDFYSLFLAFAQKVSQLPLSAENRGLATSALTSFGEQVDAVIKDTFGSDRPIPQNITDYVKNVERAASDLATRSERDRVLKELLGPVFL